MNMEQLLYKLSIKISVGNNLQLNSFHCIVEILRLRYVYDCELKLKSML